MKRKIIWTTLTALLFVNIFVWSVVFAAGDNELTVSFLNVGQGDAMFIEAPNGNQMLIDAGPNKNVLSELGRIMPFWDRSIDIVLATHPDKDHIGGLPEILKRYDVNYIFETDVKSDTAVFEEFDTRADSSDAQRISARAGQILWLDSDVYIQILFPDRNVSGLEANAASVIARLVYGETEFMLTGDSPKSIENYLAASYGEGLQSDVLKLGHHGSKTSTSELFLGYVSPALAIISAGKENRYGHPHEEVMSIIEKFGIENESTKNGTVTIVSDGVDVRIKK
ncbi:ComEC/Rec2 family competence protein [Patescibacteria group bacterium]